ncbi:MAG: amidophosphoribosyltransferase [Christensenellales bacterium]|jgi:amidophosphoribosyltransferase
MNGSIHGGARFELLKPRGDRMSEECGVIGAFDPTGAPVGDILYYGLYALQHRGQESAGIAVSDGAKIHYLKDKGLVTECFQSGAALEDLGAGYLGIGHVRYSTAGDKQMVNAQPLVIRYGGGDLALAHNGNLINAGAIRGYIQSRGGILQTDVDTEVIANLIARRSHMPLVEALSATSADIQGSYALVLLTEDKLLAMRDPLGIRPLALGKAGDAYVVASESCAFDAVGGELIRDIRPGEILVADRDGLHSHQTQVPLHSDLCIFEFVYFARTDTQMDGISVYEAREKAGMLLAKKHPVEADIVVGVPDSAIPAAIGYSKASGIPYGEGLAKNRYVGRTFIQPQQAQREESVKIKLNALKKNVQGKRVVLVDDSIVRGTTSRKIVEMLRSAGAREVHMRISSPQVTHPCYFGIDIAEPTELIGAGMDVEGIRQRIGADSLAYLTLGDLLKTVEGSGCGFCHGCFNGNYPMDVENLRGYEPREGAQYE